MPESEASFQAIVDPYARADFFIAFGEEGVELEEGFITFPTLPGGLLAKVGKMRAAFGKVNTLHSTSCRGPIVRSSPKNLVGGEEGIADAGLSVARLIPNPWLFLEATGQVFRGDSGDIFQSSRRSDLELSSGRLRGYQDLTESTNVDLGVSYARGHNAVGRRRRRRSSAGSRPTLFGVDATFRWRPLQRSIYRSFIGRSEVDLEPPRPAGRPAGRDRLLRVGRLPVRAALVRRRPARPLGSRRRRVAARHRRIGCC